MKFHHLKRQSDYDEWDNFVIKCTKGHFAQLSTFLNSFTTYGADYKIIIAKEDEKIIAGMGLLIFGKGPFKLVSLPMGPVIENGYEEIFHDIINEGFKFSKQINAFLFQLQIPYNEQNPHPYLYSSVKLPEAKLAKEGFPFKVGSVVNQFFVVELDIDTGDKTWEEAIRSTFDSKTRRNLRTSEKNELELREAKSETEIKEAYELMVENGITQGYATRSWEDFSPIIMDQVKKNQAVFLTVFKDGQLLGSHYGIIAGNSYNYIMGSTRRIEKDYKVGHFLHWNVIKKAKSLGLNTYDFSSVGSPGVYKFKMGFSPKQYIFSTPYYYVLSANKYKLFYKLFPFVKKYKKILSKFISSLVKKQNNKAISSKLSTIQQNKNKNKSEIQYEIYDFTDNFDDWDSFVKNCARGHYAQYSSYLNSFSAYGADYKVIIAIQNDKIVAGIGFILFNKFGFKISSIPAGPIISVNYEYLSVDLINEAINYCFENKYIFLQITTLSHKDYAEDNLLPYIDIPNDKFRPLEGTPFRLTPIPNQFFYVNLKTLTDENTWEENMLKGFAQEGRRRIKKAKEHNLIFKEVTDIKEMEVAYTLLVENAKTQGYKIRSWKDYKKTMLMQIKKKQAYLFTTSIDNELICAHYGIIAGKSYFYTLGGTKRTDIDYSVGHFIHWNVIKFAKTLNLDYYDFGSNGTKGVLRFKKSFKPTKVIFNEPIFYVFSPVKFFFLKRILPIVKKYKSQFAYLMKKLK